MQPTRSEPHITAVLSSAQTELDLSGQQPFNLSITLTLHAKAPIICYIDAEDTFFIRRNSLHKVGIRFRDQHTNKLQERTERACTGSWHLQIQRDPSPSGLSPSEPVNYEVMFTGHRNRGCGRSFSPSFYIATSGFKAGRTYQATLPADRKISWWRWASSSEAEGQGHEASTIISVLRFLVRSGVLWWTGDKERKQGVPVLPEDEQLPIYIEGDGVVSSCVGKPMEWRLRNDEEERQFAEERRKVRKNR